MATDALEAFAIPSEHVPAGAAATVACDLFLNGAAPPDDYADYPTAAVTIERGETTIASGAAERTGNQYRFAYVTPADLGLLTVTWTFTGDPDAGDHEHHVDVVARRAATMVGLNRVLYMGAASTSYTEMVKRLALQLAVDAFELEANQVFTRRRATLTTRTSRSASSLVLDVNDLQTVHSITQDGTAWDSGEVDDLEVDDDEIFGSFAAGAYVVDATYGPSTPTLDVPRAIELVAASTLANGPWNDRGYAVDDGTGLIRLLTAGVSGASFSIPEVQATLNRVRIPYAGGSR